MEEAAIDMRIACCCAVALFAVAVAAVTDGCSSSPPISVRLSPSSPQTIDQGQTVGITATLTNDMSSKGVAWSLTGPGSLSNSTGLSVTYNSPTTKLTSGQQATVMATSGADQTKRASVQINVNPYPEIPSQTFANGSVGTPYTQTIALTGGTPPFQWSVYNGPIGTGYKVGGAVPDGLTLNPNSGNISGTPTGGGTWYFEATVTDATGATVINGLLSIQINSVAPPGNPVPFLNQPLVPTAVSPGSSGFTLSVGGTGFVPGATINFNRTPLATTFIDNGHLAAMVPAADVASAGTAAVTVVNSGPGGGSSNVAYFQVAAAETTVNFAPAMNLPLQNYQSPAGITVGDFNEDGKPDLAIAGNIWVHLLLGNGDGTFAPAPGFPIRVASPPYNGAATPNTTAIVAGDFNHSGHLGLAVVDTSNAATYMLLGNGDGTFAPSSAAFARSPLFDVTLATADLNGDGNLDLTFQNGVVLGYGDGAFSAAGSLYASFPESVALGDFNRDGKLDAVVANGSTKSSPGSELTVSLGNGDGTFTPGSTISLGSDLLAVITADLNGDGKLDLAVADAGSNTVMVLLGNGDGTFGAPTTMPVGNEPEALVAGDFNNDGKLDLAVANFNCTSLIPLNCGQGTVTILLGNGDGTFTQASGSPYTAGKGPVSIAAADFNGDGKLDIAVANLTDGTVSIFLQQ